MSKIKKIVISALLLAILIISDRFLSINTNFFTINLSFIPSMIVAILLGPVYGALVLGLTDYIGAHLFPFGEYFPGFTVSAVLKGFICGLLLHPGLKETFLETKIGETKIGETKIGNIISKMLLPKDASIKRFMINLVITLIIVRFGINIFIQAFWLNILYGKAYVAIIMTRLVTQATMFVVQIIVAPIIYKITKKEMDKFLMEE